MTTDDDARANGCAGTDQCSRFESCTAADIDAVGDHAAKVDIAVHLPIQDDICWPTAGGKRGTDLAALSRNEFDTGGVWSDRGVGIDDDIAED